MTAGDWIIVGYSLAGLFVLGCLRLSGEADETGDALLRRLNAGDDVRLADVWNGGRH